MNNRSKQIAVLVFIQLLSHTIFAQWNADKAVNNTVIAHQGRQESSVSCSDGNGGAIIAWYDNRGANGNPLYDVYVQHINATGQTEWATDGISLGVVTSGYGDMDITSDGNGGAVIAFISGSGSTLLILAQRVDGNGSRLWNSGTPVTVCNAAQAQFHPRIANAGDGTFVITWQDQRAGTNLDDLYAQKYDAGGVAQWTADGVLVNAAINNQEAPEIISIGGGEVIIAWEDFRSGDNYDVYAQKLNAAGIRQWRGLDNLLSGRVISNAAANQRSPKICRDGGTGAIISWQDFRNGNINSTDIYAQRIDSAGLLKWVGNGVLLCGTTDVQEISAITFTADGAVVCWLNYPASGSYDSYDVYAQKVDTGGVVKWGADGIAVCNAVDLQNLIRSAPDGSGGAFFTWVDRRNGNITNSLIYAQRISSNGVPAWTANGVLLCNAIENRYNPSIVASGCTAVFIWEDSRNSCCSIVDIDIYATALDCNGNVIGASVDIIWEGTSSSDWADPSNWSANTVPTVNDNISIPAGTAFSPIINNGVNALCKKIQINNGAFVTVSTGGNLKVGVQ